MRERDRIKHCRCQLPVRAVFAASRYLLRGSPVSRVPWQSALARIVGGVSLAPSFEGPTWNRNAVLGDRSDLSTLISVRIVFCQLTGFGPRLEAGGPENDIVAAGGPANATARERFTGTPVGIEAVTIATVESGTSSQKPLLEARLGLGWSFGSPTLSSTGRSGAFYSIGKGRIGSRNSTVR
jgi:hypothetical protein